MKDWLKELKITGFYYDASVTGNVGEVFYTSSATEDDCIEIIPDYNTDETYIILYLKGCQLCKAEVFGNSLKEADDAKKNMSVWIQSSIPKLMNRS